MKRNMIVLISCVSLVWLLVHSVSSQPHPQADTNTRIRLWQLYYKLRDGTALTSDENTLFQQYHNDPNTIYAELYGISPKAPILPPTPTPPKQPTRAELSAQIQKLKDALATAEREIVHYQQWVATLQERIAERDREISRLNLQLTRIEQRINPPPRTGLPQESSRTPTSQDPSLPPQQEGVLSCLPKKTCAEIPTCEEAQYRLKICGDESLDEDNDGIPCETTICQGQR